MVWQKSKAIFVELRSKFKCKDYFFNNQLFRALLSISNNIAEGYERKSNNEFRQFLYIAKGSCGESRSMLIIAIELGYIGKAQGNEAIDRLTEISKMISGLIKKL